THPRAEVRAAAANELKLFSAGQVEAEVLAALKDAASPVRTAAAHTVYWFQDNARTGVMPDGDMPEPSPAGDGIFEAIGRLWSGSGAAAPPAPKPVPAADPDAKLAEARGGKGRAPWLSKAIPSLEAMLSAADAEER